VKFLVKWIEAAGCRARNGDARAYIDWRITNYWVNTVASVEPGHGCIAGMMVTVLYTQRCTTVKYPCRFVSAHITDTLNNHGGRSTWKVEGTGLTPEGPRAGGLLGEGAASRLPSPHQIESNPNYWPIACVDCLNALRKSINPVIKVSVTVRIRSSSKNTVPTKKVQHQTNTDYINIFF